MSEYDPKSIPILDDVIKKADKKSGDAESSIKSKPDNNDADLFTATTDAVIPMINDIDTSKESALIDYPSDENNAPTVPTGDNTAGKQAVSTTKKISVEKIVDDVVRQLMPDLEQQLRFLLQHALKDSLPKKSYDSAEEQDT